ncbi:hypothetical protein [Numidum massiliense]|uniref:hypothetical protein n=1 Tax=Numidum massiliense TaxID=1522315 RepID=UPI0006D551EE|nr:hypothetical protein [Numidum massiliense]
MLFKRTVLLHRSYGTPRVVYRLQKELEYHNIRSSVKLTKQKKMTYYELRVHRHHAAKARHVLQNFKVRLEKGV